MTCYDSEGKEVIIRGFFAEFVDAMIRDGGAVSYRDCPGGDSHSAYRTAGHIGVTPFDVESFKRVSESLCVDSGVKPLYHAQLIGCETNGRQITIAYIATVRGIERINAKMFIDATGSASLAKMAGAGDLPSGRGSDRVDFLPDRGRRQGTSRRTHAHSHRYARALLHG